MTQDENTKLDLQQPADAMPKESIVKKGKSPKKNSKGMKRSMLIAVLAGLLVGGAICAYFFVPWKSIFGKENVRTVTDDEEEDAKMFTGINPFNGKPVADRKFTAEQIDKMKQVEWSPRELSREEVESLVLIPEKKVVIGYNMTYGDNVVYVNALGPTGGLLWGDSEITPSEDQEFAIFPTPVEEVLAEIEQQATETELKIVDDEPKEILTSEEQYDDDMAIGVMVVDIEAENAKNNAAIKEVVDRAPATEAQKEEEVFRAVEQMPVYPGGDAALYKAINDNLRYPPVAAENNIQGRVVVQFVVQKDGTIGKVEVARGVDPDLDKEAVRVVKKLGKFNPGRNNGVPVAVWYTLPIIFKLQAM